MLLSQLKVNEGRVRQIRKEDLPIEQEIECPRCLDIMTLHSESSNRYYNNCDKYSCKSSHNRYRCRYRSGGNLSIYYKGSGEKAEQWLTAVNECVHACRTTIAVIHLTCFTLLVDIHNF
jgi:hypothetical protein